MIKIYEDFISVLKNDFIQSNIYNNRVIWENYYIVYVDTWYDWDLRQSTDTIFLGKIVERRFQQEAKIDIKLLDYYSEIDEKINVKVSTKTYVLNYIKDRILFVSKSKTDAEYKFNEIKENLPILGDINKYNI